LVIYIKTCRNGGFCFDQNIVFFQDYISELLIGARGSRSTLMSVCRSYPQVRITQVPGAREFQATIAEGNPPTFGVLCKSRERRYSERTGLQVPIMRSTICTPFIYNLFQNLHLVDYRKAINQGECYYESALKNNYCKCY
jgi:hypothetical protein